MEVTKWLKPSVWLVTYKSPQRPPQAHAARALMRGATRKAARGQS
jgi:hypothetical protein